MPLLQPTIEQRTKTIRMNINEKLYERIVAYCDWANIKKPEEFFEQSATIILNKDKDWKKYLSNKE